MELLYIDRAGITQHPGYFQAYLSDYNYSYNARGHVMPVRYKLRFPARHSARRVKCPPGYKKRNLPAPNAGTRVTVTGIVAEG